MAIDTYLVFLILIVMSDYSLSVSGQNTGHRYTTETDLQEKLDRFEKYVNSVLACRNVPSAVVLLLKDKKVLLSKGFGMADREKGVRVTEHTKFPIGSLTKAFTSTVIALILEENKNITWETPIRQILGPTFRLTDDLRSNHVNLRDILGHKVGVPEYFAALMVGFPENVSRSEFVRRIQYLPAKYPFRTKFQYNNYMYTLGGHIAEHLGKASWENLVWKKIFRPLEMYNSSFVDQANLGNFANPYVLVNGSLVPIDIRLVRSVHPSGPAGSIYSTADDMAKWLLLQMNHGLDQTGRMVIPQKRLEELHESGLPQPFAAQDLSRPDFPIDDISISYGMGWATSVYRGYKRIWHSGGIVTYSALIWMFPEKDIAIFAVITGPQNSNRVITMKVLVSMAADILLGEPPWLNITTACSYPAPWKDEIVTKYPPKLYNSGPTWTLPRSAHEYTGIFSNLAFGDIVLYVEKDSVLMLLFGRFGKMKLYPLNEKHFHGRYIGELWFVTDSDDSFEPIPIDFSFSADDRVDGVLFPVDSKFPKSLFQKNVKGPTYETKTVGYQNIDEKCTSGNYRFFYSTAVLLPLMFLHVLLHL